MVVAIFVNLSFQQFEPFFCGKLVEKVENIFTKTVFHMFPQVFNVETCGKVEKLSFAKVPFFRFLIFPKSCGFRIFTAFADFGKNAVPGAFFGVRFTARKRSWKAGSSVFPGWFRRRRVRGQRAIRLGGWSTGRWNGRARRRAARFRPATARPFPL